MTYDERSRRAKELRDDLDARHQRDLMAVLSSTEGRRFLAHLVYGMCGVRARQWRSSAEIHLLEGKRQVGISVLELAQAVAPGLWADLEREAINMQLEAIELERLERLAQGAEP